MVIFSLLDKGQQYMGKRVINERKELGTDEKGFQIKTYIVEENEGKYQRTALLSIEPR